MTALEEQSNQKRRQIIAGAGAVFTEDGYGGASMSRIAAEANVSKGTLYNYFDSKSALFAAFVSQKAASELPGLFAPIDSDGSIDHVLHEIGAGMTRMILSPSSLLLYRIVVAEAGKFPHLAQIFWETGPKNTLTRMAEWLAKCMADGRLRQEDPLFAAGQFFALCQTPACTMRRLRLAPELSDTELHVIIEGAVRVFLDSYALPGATDASPAAKPLTAAAGHPAATPSRPAGNQPGTEQERLRRT